MSYLPHHHSTFWFQLRVPAMLVPRYSQFVHSAVRYVILALQNPSALLYLLGTQSLR
jgi:hypothetical protein